MNWKNPLVGICTVATRTASPAIPTSIHGRSLHVLCSILLDLRLQEQFELLREVGRGSYGSAMLAMDRISHMTVVIKRISVGRVSYVLDATFIFIGAGSSLQACQMMKRLV
jgi:hypothetical protein